jgi:predicted nucleotidyltransferase
MARLAALLAAREEVRLAYLFGSRASGRAQVGSDWDVGVVLGVGTPPERRLEIAAALGAELGEPVDVVALDRAPIEFAARVVCEGKILFERSVAERVEFEARTLARAHDLAPLLARQRREILEGGPHDRAVERYRAALGAARRVRKQA